MNDRIAALVKQAHLEADATYTKSPDSVWLKEYNKKFTELLVKECWALVDHNNKQYIKAQFPELFGVEK